MSAATLQSVNTAGPEFNPQDDYGSIRIDEIEFGDRLRPIDDDWAEALGQIMAREGQQTPIEVCRLPGRNIWTLVTGAHRLRGADLAEIEYIKAIVVSSDRVERRMREVSENLWRKGLDPIDRAAFIAEAVALQKAKLGVDSSKDGRATSANARWQKGIKDEAVDANDTMSVAYGWSEQVGERLGFSARTIERDLLLHRRLSRTMIASLRGHPIATNATQLRALAKLDDATRNEAVKLLLSGSAKSVGDAVATLSQKPKPDPQMKLLATFLGAFDRMGVTEKRGALDQLVGRLSAQQREAIVGWIAGDAK